MKFLIVFLGIFTLQITAMDKIVKKAGSPRGKDEKKERERPKTPRDEKQKQAADNIKESTRFAERRASDSPMIRESHSSSPLARESKSVSPLKSNPTRPHTVGKRASLDWTEALKQVFVPDSSKHTQVADSIKQWSGTDPVEEQLSKMYEDAQLATPRTRRIMLCQIMNTPIEVSQTKVKVATDIYKPHYEAAKLALYNLPGYISTNISGDQLRIEAHKFHQSFSAALAAYVDSLLAEAPKRERYKCEATARKSPSSPLCKLLMEYKELKKKHPGLKQFMEPEVYSIAEPKKP